MKTRTWFALAGFGGACALTALIGGRANAGSRRWYRSLSKPSFNPPSWVFAPVWTALYALMSLSAHRVWRAPPSPNRTRALGWWWAQLLANAAWSPLFFGAHRPRAALVDLGALMAALALYTRSAAAVDAPAAWMMAPYGAWCAFASVLNEEIARLNPYVRG
jgi:translocator protein